MAASSLLGQVRQSDVIVFRHAREGLSNKRKKLAASDKFPSDRRAVGLCLAVRHSLVRILQADAENVDERQRTDKSTGCGQLEAEQKKIGRSAGHDRQASRRQRSLCFVAFYCILLRAGRLVRKAKQIPVGVRKSVDKVVADTLAASYCQISGNSWNKW